MQWSEVLVLSFTALVVEQRGQAGNVKRMGAGALCVDGMGLCMLRADGRGNMSHVNRVGSMLQSDGRWYAHHVQMAWAHEVH
jgi:hypothetical protein